MSATMKKADPLKKNGCRYGDPMCMVEGGKDCAHTGVVYEITCSNCNGATILLKARGLGSTDKYNYIGMTRISALGRMHNHLRGQESRTTANPLHFPLPS